MTTKDIARLLIVAPLTILVVIVLLPFVLLYDFIFDPESNLPVSKAK